MTQVPFSLSSWKALISQGLITRPHWQLLWINSFLEATVEALLDEARFNPQGYLFLFNSSVLFLPPFSLWVWKHMMFCVLHICSNFTSPVTNGTVWLISFSDFCCGLFSRCVFYFKIKTFVLPLSDFSKGNWPFLLNETLLGKSFVIIVQKRYQHTLYSMFLCKNPVWFSCRKLFNVFIAC